ncbi:hypothetical protein [Mesorhizobium sophorae]|uniref:hypothetical protein n=1 Tax=Mesorhizobium sophorae TaxID=1300294 RepID=UPI000BA4B035|nr:hypothetical protein [Mesorhizobium sophorae]
MASFADLVNGWVDLDQLVVTNNSPILISAPRRWQTSEALVFTALDADFENSSAKDVDSREIREVFACMLLAREAA